MSVTYDPKPRHASLKSRLPGERHSRIEPLAHMVPERGICYLRTCAPSRITSCSRKNLRLICSTGFKPIIKPVFKATNDNLFRFTWPAIGASERVITATWANTRPNTLPQAKQTLSVLPIAN